MDGEVPMIKLFVGPCVPPSDWSRFDEGYCKQGCKFDTCQSGLAFKLLDIESVLSGAADIYSLICE